MKTKRITAAILLCALALSASSCFGGSDNPANTAQTSGTSDSTASETAAQTEAPTGLAALGGEKYDFGGADFTLFVWDTDTEYSLESATGDVVEDACYKRMADISEYYNVSLKTLLSPGAGDFKSWINTLESSVLAGDDAYQLAGGFGHNLCSYSFDGNFADLSAIPTMDFSQPWWGSSALSDSISLGNSFYIAYGPASLYYWKLVYVMYYNKSVAEQYGLENLYDAVDSGSWTIDKMIACTADASADLDGDGKMTKSDRYGFITNRFMNTDAWYNAFDIARSTRDSDGIPVLAGVTDKYASAAQKLYDFIYGSGRVYYSDDDMTEIFMNDRALFMSNSMNQAGVCRAMEADFGLLPYPKWDEAQEKYGAYAALGNETGFAIPATANSEESGLILEALSYLGYTDVGPAFYDIALKGKTARDDDSGRMLDLIYSSLVYDFTDTYSQYFGDGIGPIFIMRDCFTAKNANVASSYAAKENKMQAALDKLISVFGKGEN